MRKSPPNRMMTDELEHRIIDMYKSGMSAQQIVDDLQIFKTPKTIYDTLYKYGLKARSGDTMRDPNMDHSYFEVIDSPNKAYLLGLMISDGWVTKPQTSQSGHQIKSPQIAFSLSVPDAYLVEWVKREWQSQNKISIISKEPSEYPNGKIYQPQDMARIVVSSPKMYSDLNRLGVDTMKSYLSILPPIDKTYYSHLLRGVFDGDGSVGVYQYGLDTALSMKFLGTQCLMGQISMYLYDTLGVTYVKPSGRKNAVLSDITYSTGDDTKRVAEYIYQDVEKSQCLMRKRKIVEDYFG